MKIENPFCTRRTSRKQKKSDPVVPGVLRFSSLSSGYPEEPVSRRLSVREGTGGGGVYRQTTINLSRAAVHAAARPTPAPRLVFYYTYIRAR